jgi:hypothetical protein
MVFSIIVPIWFLYEFIVAGYFASGIIISVLIYVIMYLIVIRRPISHRNLARSTGDYFWFSNIKFFKEFAILNPKLVRPNHLYFLVPSTSETASANRNSEFRSSSFDVKSVLLVLVAVIVMIVFCVIPLLVVIFG